MALENGRTRMGLALLSFITMPPTIIIIIRCFSAFNITFWYFIYKSPRIASRVKPRII